MAALNGEQTPSEAGMQKLVKRFSLTATTVKTARTPEEDPLAPWRTLAGASANDFPAKWQTQAKQLTGDVQQRAEFNRQQFLAYADFSTGQDLGWRRDGHGLRTGPGRAGDFTLYPQGDALVQAILPGGWFSHALFGAAQRHPPVSGTVIPAEAAHQFPGSRQVR